MKKTLKKLTSLTLVLMLVFSLFSMQASAGLFDKIQSAELLPGATVTSRELDEYIADMEEYGWEDEGDYIYYVYPNFEVTLSTGEVIVTEGYGYGLSENGKRQIDVLGWVDIRDYQEAVKKGENTVRFTYEIYLLSSIDIEMDCLTGEAEIEIVECYVKELIPVSGLPETYRELNTIESVLLDTEPCDLEGAVFDIVYGDGTTVRATVESVYDEEYEYWYYELDGEEIYYYYDYETEEIVLVYADIEVGCPVEFIPYPISDIVIDSVDVNDAFEVVSVTYTVTLSDETERTFTFSFDENEYQVELLGVKGYIAESIDGAYVFIGTAKGYTDDYPSAELLEVIVMADIHIMAIEEIEGEVQKDTLINRLIYKIRMFLIKIFDFLYFLY